jgi:pimeloyl-ACP methyl ester carboxylesterase
VLIAGAASSMDWWDEELCRRIADRGRFVVRYDHRDTGQSTSYPAGSPSYSGGDLRRDVVSVIDALGLPSAHLAGVSMGGAIAMVVALEQRERVASLTVISSSSTAPGEDGLPGMDPSVSALFADPPPPPDWSDREAAVRYMVENERPYAGPGDFEESRSRALAERVYDRTRDIAATMTNHWILEDDGGAIRPRLSELAGLRTLVMHGTADPMFPPEHGRALAREIPGARLIELDGMGHGFPPPRLWDVVAGALAEQSAEP